jgi:GDP-L-fucose synthase
MKTNDSILITGGNGMAGRALQRVLKNHGFRYVWAPSRKEVDFTDAEQTKWIFKETRPDFVFHLAAKVGGIRANIEHPVEFFTENVAMQNTVFQAAHKATVEKLLFVASAAVYPERGPLSAPLSPEDLMTGHLDETKGGYAMAKLAGIKLCQYFRKEYRDNFISVIPNNLYGPHDNFDPVTSHVVPAMISRFHIAKTQKSDVACWGTGKARREFLYVDDFAEACIFLMNECSDGAPINVGTGEDVSMCELAYRVAEVVDYPGTTRWDTTKPEGTARRLLDVSKITELGWAPKVTLMDGLKKTYEYFLCQPH